jgi:hypothetical protein
VNSIITGLIETSEGSTITLDGTSSTTFGGTIASYSWVIDSEEVGTAPTYTLAAEDDCIIAVSLTVTNSLGCTDSTTHSVTVTNVAQLLLVRCTRGRQSMRCHVQWSVEWRRVRSNLHHHRQRWWG